ncbi:MAG: IPT/TIG domain-containing protein, partial [Actinomycetota bacterium]
TFNSVGGQPRTGLAALDLQSGQLLPWNPNLIKGTDVQYVPHEIEVRDVAVWRDRLIAVGHFSEAGIPGNPDENGNNRFGHVGAFDLVDGAPLPWESKPEYPVFSVAANTNYVYWSGAGKGPPRNDIAQLDPLTGRMLHRYATDGNQQSVHATDDWLFIGGHHDNIVPDRYASAGEEESLGVRHRLMIVDATTFELHPFAPGVDNTGDGVWSVQADGESLVVGGEFRRIDGVTVNGLTRYELKDPHIRSVSPSRAPIGAEELTVSIHGSNLPGDPSVEFGPGVTVRSVRPVSPRQLDVVISTSDAVEGIQPVSVTGDGGRARCLSTCFAVAIDPLGPDDGGPVAPAGPVAGSGYWMVATDGGIFAFGDAEFYGSTGNIRLNKPIVGMATTPSGNGYWLVASDGGVFSYGDAEFYGSTGNIKLNQPIVGMTTTPSGRGYWMVASDGGIFAFGDAAFYGSTGNIKLNQPIVGMTTAPGGSGYWLVASDGGIFAFGSAQFFGSTGNIRLAKPITAMTATRSGNGYWMTATDGGIFAFGDATFHGSAAGQSSASIVAMSTSRSGSGYLMVNADGKVFRFGDAEAKGDLTGTTLAKPIVGMTGF